MRTLFAHINVSLDGFIDDAAGDIDWAFSDAEWDDYMDSVLESIDGMVFGRVAYELLAPYWPTAGDEVTATQRRLMHELPKYVLSRTLTHADWHHAQPLGAEPLAALRDLKQEPGRDLAVFAGGSAISSLLEADLLDELRLILNPILLVGGTRLFQGGYPRTAWRLQDTRRFASGALVLTYAKDAA